MFCDATGSMGVLDVEVDTVGCTAKFDAKSNSIVNCMSSVNVMRLVSNDVRMLAGLRGLLATWTQERSAPAVTGYYRGSK